MADIGSRDAGGGNNPDDVPTIGGKRKSKPSKDDVPTIAGKWRAAESSS